MNRPLESETDSSVSRGDNQQFWTDETRTKGLRLVPQGHPTIAQRFNAGWTSEIQRPSPAGTKEIASRVGVSSLRD